MEANKGGLINQEMNSHVYLFIFIYNAYGSTAVSKNTEFSVIQVNPDTK